MNQVYILGRSGADAELYYSQSGTPVCTLSVAVTEFRKEAQETHWFRVVIFGKFAEAMVPKIKKGSELFVQGKLTSREWTDKNNQKKTSVEIIANVLRITEAKRYEEENDGIQM